MAPSVVQTQDSSTTSGATLTVTLTSTGSQHTLIVCIGDNGVSNNATSVVTSGGQNLVNAIVETDSAGSTAEIWYLDNVPGGQTSVTVNWASSAPSHANAVAYEVSGVYASGGSLDKTSGNFADTATPTSWTSSATATLSQASEIAIGSSAQVGIGISITGPSSPWTNTIINSNGGIAAGYNVVSATTGLAYAGSTTHAGTAHTSTAIATFKAGTPPPASSTSPFYAPSTGRGRPATRRGTSASSPGAAYVEFPSKFTLPRRPAKGAQAAVKGLSRSSPGAAYVEFPSKFYAPHKPAKGAAEAVRGSSRSSPGAKYIHVIPPGPSPFTLPTGPSKGRPAIVRGLGRSSAGAPYVGPAPFVPPVKPSKGASATRRGSGSGHPGAPYFHVSTFILPTRPAKGASATRRGISAAEPGAKWVAVTHPSKFYAPHKPAKGASAAVRGRSTGHAGARFVLIRISPFYPRHKPAKGASIMRRGTSGAGSATGQGSPQSPRQLIIALASEAGTDDYGNRFPQGIQATAGVIQGPEFIADGANGDILVYSGTPASGNLIGSWAGMAGTDAYGNSFPQGILAAAGVIEGSTFIGEDFIIDAAGAFFYSGTPAFGNLIASIATVAGTDGFGNSYPQGLNVTTGTITGTTFTAGDTVINSSGTFVYSGTPGLGNLIASVAPATGTDGFGNDYYAGVCSYTPSGGSVPGLVSQLANGAVSLAPGYALGSGASAGGLQNPNNAGQTNLFSGQATGGDNQSFIDLQSQDVSGAGSGLIQLSAGTVETTADLTVGNNLGIDGGTLYLGTGSTANIQMNPAMGVPPNYPLPTTGGTTQVNDACAALNNLIGEMINRGMIT